MSDISSSSSSGDEGTLVLPIRVEGVFESPIWCFASRTNADNVRTIYAGTGPFGIVLSSTDLKKWTTFMTVDDAHVTSAIIWANALFVGTKPNGRIFVHNFTSNQEYLFVETEDEAVTALVEYNGVLYAGTSPSGIVYSFDGSLWNEEYRPYGGGVSAMAVSSEGLIVFSQKAEGPVVLSGGQWQPYPKGTSQTTASSRVATRGIHGNEGQNELVPKQIVSINAGTSEENVAEVRPTLPQFNVLTASVRGSEAIFGGSSNGVVLVTGGNAISKLLDVGSPVNALLNVSDKAVMVASGNTIFLAQEHI